MKRAKIHVVRHAQCTEFRKERAALSRVLPLPANSKLLGLQAKLDDGKLLRSDTPMTTTHFFRGQIGSQFEPTTENDTQLSTKEMTLDTGVSPLFLALMATRMATLSRYMEETISEASRYTGRRGGTDHLSRHGTRKLASRESNRSLPRYRRTSARRQVPGGTGHSGE